MSDDESDELPEEKNEVHYKEEEFLKNVLSPDEKVILKVPSDLSLNGQYLTSYLIVTKDSLISYDRAHEGNCLKIGLDKIEQCEIERMYSNSILQVVVDGQKIDINRFSNSCLDYFEEIVSTVNKPEKKAVNTDNAITENGKKPETKYRCPKCGRTLQDKNSICVLCIDKKKVVQRLLKYIRPHAKLTGMVLMLSLVTIVIPLVPPYITKILIDDVLPAGNMNKLWQIVAMVFVLYLVNSLLSGVRGYNLSILSEKIIFGLRTEVFAKIQFLAVKYYDKRSTGSIMSRVSNDTQRIQAFLISLTQNILLQLLTLAIIMIIMLGMHWQLALISMLPIPLVIWGSKIYARRMRPKYRRIWRRISKMNAFLGDVIPGIKVIKAFSTEDRVVNQYTRQGEELINEHRNAARMANIFSPLIGLLVMTGGLVVWALGGYWVITKPDIISIGVLIAFISYVGMFYAPVTFFANFNDQLQQAATSAERVFEILDSEPEPDMGKNNIIEKLDGKLEFKNVEFYYEKSNPILKGITFSVESGETLGIVGSTGSGKSTIANLMLRYYDCTNGNIFIDGHEISTIDKSFLRKNIGYVLQEPLLFRDNVVNNISYSKPEASIEEIITAAKVANAHGFISRFPDAYDTILGERGTGLSGGEKQRISIARTVINNPRILMLDEATSAVDAETEKLIQEAIDRLIENRTTLIIAHRLSTLRKADKILVLEKGAIVEFGTQNELMANKDRFYKLVKMQTDMGIDIIDYKNILGSIY
ncbi:MAG: ABC transporter ATP-binding protein/permease [Actinomycetia bacterium]|nr:ABC transporter ATP-binding protein/permease [Actinomycetes bacterium]